MQEEKTVGYRHTGRRERRIQANGKKRQEDTGKWEEETGGYRHTGKKRREDAGKWKEVTDRHRQMRRRDKLIQVNEKK